MRSRTNRRRRALAAVLAAICLLPAFPGGALASRGEDAMAARWEAMGRYYAALEKDSPAAVAAVPAERTIVRDTEDVLARVIAGVALLVPLAAGGWALLRYRGVGISARAGRSRS